MRNLIIKSSVVAADVEGGRCVFEEGGDGASERRAAKGQVDSSSRHSSCQIFARSTYYTKFLIFQCRGGGLHRVGVWLAARPQQRVHVSRRPAAQPGDAPCEPDRFQTAFHLQDNEQWPHDESRLSGCYCGWWRRRRSRVWSRVWSGVWSIDQRQSP